MEAGSWLWGTSERGRYKNQRAPRKVDRDADETAMLLCPLVGRASRFATCGRQLVITHKSVLVRIESLSVDNFRAITTLSLAALQDTVVVAGPNGCGKSCVFDAIRLLKSVYGGYLPNEWQSWFGEFQINFNQRDTDWLVLFQSRSQ